jgi:hypothetical protein
MTLTWQIVTAVFRFVKGALYGTGLVATIAPELVNNVATTHANETTKRSIGR